MIKLNGFENNWIKITIKDDGSYSLYIKDTSYYKKKECIENSLEEFKQIKDYLNNMKLSIPEGENEK